MNISTSCDASHLWERQQLRSLFLRPATPFPSGRTQTRRVRHPSVHVGFSEDAMCVVLSSCGFLDFSAVFATCVTLRPHVGHSCPPAVLIRHARHYGSPRGLSQHLCVGLHTCAPCCMVLNSLRAARTPGERDGEPVLAAVVHSEEGGTCGPCCSALSAGLHHCSKRKMSHTHITLPPSYTMHRQMRSSKSESCQFNVMHCHKILPTRNPSHKCKDNNSKDPFFAMCNMQELWRQSELTMTRQSRTTTSRRKLELRMRGETETVRRPTPMTT